MFDSVFPLSPAGTVRRIAPPTGLPDTINRTVWAPDESSLKSEFAFRWGPLNGSGSIYYFELAEDVVPNWFGVVVPDSLDSYEHVHIFFHPTPGQVHPHGVQVYKDENYKSKKGWAGVFHYMTDDMAVQFCGAHSGQVLVIPLMTTGAAGTCGMFPQRWEWLVGEMLGQIRAGDGAQTWATQPVSSVVVSSFSSGIAYSHAFRHRANLGSKLLNVIDFDGIISSSSINSQALPPNAVKMWQKGTPSQPLSDLALRNIFPVPPTRFNHNEGPYPGLFKPQDVLRIHGTIPQTMMSIAAKRTRVN